MGINIKTLADVSRDLVDGDKVTIDTGTELASATMEAVALYTAGDPDGSTPDSLWSSVIAIRDVQLVTTSTDTITRQYVFVLYAGGVCTLTMPSAADVPYVQVYRANAGGYSIVANRAGSDTINALTSFTILPAFGGAQFHVVGAGSWGAGVILDATATDARITALEAPSATTNSASSSVSWTTAVEYLHTHTSLTTYTLNATTAQWPVGTARAISQYGTSTAGFQFAVPSGHKLNSVTNGVSGVLAKAAADDGAALQTFLVTRRASDEWTWA